MVVQCKKGKLFITGEVFPLDIGLLMGAVCVTFGEQSETTICGVLVIQENAPQVFTERLFIWQIITTPMDTHTNLPPHKEDRGC
jgi:hypothetical protein